MRTVRQRRGAVGEEVAVAWLVDRAWRVVARNVKVGRDEIDIVAVDPGPQAELVCVEVRSATSVAFGTPEERISRAKIGNLYRAARAFCRSQQASELGVGGYTVRVDLLIVDRRRGLHAVRHLRSVEPP